MPHPKQLIVEGVDDLSAISNLARARFADFKKDRKYLVEIKSGDGVKKILVKSYIDAILKQSGLEAIGFVFDADDEPNKRWKNFRNLLNSYYPDIPKLLPNDGLIVEQTEKPRLGFWMMPDCQSKGMLEDFLHHLVPNHAKDAVWNYAKEATSAAKTHGAPYKKAHRTKAEIHTWLAWQDEPGKRFGAALAAKILDPHAATAQPFLKWFEELFNLTLSPSPAVTP